MKQENCDRIGHKTTFISWYSASPAERELPGGREGPPGIPTNLGRGEWAIPGVTSQEPAKRLDECHALKVVRTEGVDPVDDEGHLPGRAAQAPTRSPSRPFPRRIACNELHTQPPLKTDVNDFHPTDHQPGYPDPEGKNRSLPGPGTPSRWRRGIIRRLRRFTHSLRIGQVKWKREEKRKDCV